MKSAEPDARAPALTIRLADRSELPEIVRMLADDVLGEKRESVETPLPDSYYRAFDAIERDPNNELVVAELDGRLVGVLQLTYIAYLTYRGSSRALIEGVRIASPVRSRGIGRKLIEWAIDRAREKGCAMVQLTSDKSRADAVRFYESLGFSASHVGLKLRLKS